jgi:tRNA G18 (ribose-2'-O)-methylase SpoU
MIIRRRRRYDRRVAAPIAISGIDDPRVEIFRDVRDKDLRGRDRLFMAESEMVLRRLLQTPARLHALLLSPERLAALGDAITLLPDAVPVYVADVAVMTEIAGFHIHRGVLAAGIRPARWELTLDRALGHLRGRAEVTILVAEGLTNVDNMGGLFRNAAAFGADGVVLDPACCDPLYRKAIRVSMGHVLSTPWAVGAVWPDDLHRLKREWGVTLVGGEITPSAVPLWEMPRAPRLAMIFGAEAHGLSAGSLAACDTVCAIPMSASVPSINVAAASAVFLYERRRGGA